MPEIFLIRPGCTDFDEQHRIQGSLDLPLNTRGQVQVERLIEQLRGCPLDVLYTAPCEPARSTAEAIGQGLGIRVKELDGLRNFDQGLWQGLLMDDVRRKYPRVVKLLQESPETICPPQGETVAQAQQRVREALRKPLKRKQPFGVVASEPMATLVRCVITDNPSGTPVPICGCQEPQLLEVLHVAGEPASDPPSSAAEPFLAAARSPLPGADAP